MFSTMQPKVNHSNLDPWLQRQRVNGYRGPLQPPSAIHEWWVADSIIPKSQQITRKPACIPPKGETAEFFVTTTAASPHATKVLHINQTTINYQNFTKGDTALLSLPPPSKHASSYPGKILTCEWVQTGNRLFSVVDQKLNCDKSVSNYDKAGFEIPTNYSPNTF